MVFNDALRSLYIRLLFRSLFLSLSRNPFYVMLIAEDCKLQESFSD